MKGSTFQRLARVGLNLAGNPRLIPRYLSTSLPRSRTPLDLALPWISFAAIDYLEGRLRPHHRVLEFGGGGSTLFFASRVQSVRTIEASTDWAARIHDHLAKGRLSNVSVEFHPQDPNDPAQCDAMLGAVAASGEKYDVILVDGYEEDIPLRPRCFHRAQDLVAPGGVILMDDSWRHPVLRKESRATRVRVLQSIGPCRRGVTSTDVHEYE
jgi:predicted O-methyltransferase YrrM